MPAKFLNLDEFIFYSTGACGNLGAHSNVLCIELKKHKVIPR
jgi:hypothetical protein